MAIIIYKKKDEALIARNASMDLLMCIPFLKYFIKISSDILSEVIIFYQILSFFKYNPESTNKRIS
jgi:hypothetical protein